VTLNRNITSRLPLCLPPYSPNPSIYTLGIARFADLFLNFEEIWDEIIADSPNNPALEDTWDAIEEAYSRRLSSSFSSNNGGGNDILSFLRTLRPAGLIRTPRIRRDIAYLRKLSSSSNNSDEKISQAAEKESEAIKAFTQHMRTTVKENPHLLIAYAWTLYMAIFSGGRWVRAQLCTAGEDFWSATASASSPAKPTSTSTSTQQQQQQPKEKEKSSHGWGNWEDLKPYEDRGLSLWFFPGAEDGEDIKTEFKRRLQDGEHMLTAAQRGEIVTEAQGIFDRCEALVQELDALALVSGVGGGEKGRVLRGARGERSAGRGAGRGAGYWYNMPGYAGLALVLSCVSWYAVYHAGTW
jgi:hypothetical protein